MSRTGNNFYKRKDGRWEACYIKCYDEKGKAKYGYIYAKSYGEAKNKQINAIGQSSFINSNNNPTMYSEVYSFINGTKKDEYGKTSSTYCHPFSVKILVSHMA